MFSNQGSFLNLIFSNVKFSIVYQTNWFLLLFFFVKELWHESFFILKKLLKFFLRIRIGLQIMEVVYDNWFQTIQFVVVKREQTGFNRERRFKYQLLFSSLKMGIILDQQNYLSCSFSPCFQFEAGFQRKQRKFLFSLLTLTKKSKLKQNGPARKELKRWFLFV